MTWVLGQVLTAAQMNEQVSENMRQTAAAKVTQIGDTVYATGPNSLTRLGIGTEGQVARVAPGNTSFQYAGSMTKLAETIYTTSGPGPFVFSGYSMNYRDLFIRFRFRITENVGQSGTTLTFNGDSGGTSYDYQNLSASSTNIQSFILWSQPSIQLVAGIGSAASSLAGRALFGNLYIPDYARTEFHKVVVHEGYSIRNRTASTDFEQGHVHGTWNNTAPITSISINCGTWAAGSTFTLYGLA
jgi:hypothetical protein